MPEASIEFMPTTDQIALAVVKYKKPVSIRMEGCSCKITGTPIIDDEGEEACDITLTFCDDHKVEAAQELKRAKSVGGDCNANPFRAS